MAETEMEIPVVCPHCRKSMLANFPIPVIVVALTSWRQMRLYASCCSKSWDASDSELQAIQDHVGELWLNVQVLQFDSERLSMVEKVTRLQSKAALSSAIRNRRRTPSVSGKGVCRPRKRLHADKPQAR